MLRLIQRFGVSSASSANSIPAIRSFSSVPSFSSFSSFSSPSFSPLSFPPFSPFSPLSSSSFSSSSSNAKAESGGKTRGKFTAQAAEKYILKSIAAENTRLKNHNIYASITTIPQLRLFMEIHCFAVWDFMSPLARLLQHATPPRIPYTNSKHPEMERLLHEIWRGESCDIRELPNGQKPIIGSHFQFYVRAMQQVGANPHEILLLNKRVAEGMPWEEALKQAQVPEFVREFVRVTLDVALNKPIHVVASLFMFSRENVIPDMFQRLLSTLNAAGFKDISDFIFYLQRHIEVDGNDHGPAGMKLVLQLCKSWKDVDEVIEWAIIGMNARYKFWDGYMRFAKERALLK